MGGMKKAGRVEMSGNMLVSECWRLSEGSRTMAERLGEMMLKRNS
jgi:hypothetical protein